MGTIITVIIILFFLIIIFGRKLWTLNKQKKEENYEHQTSKRNK